jgi:sodium transport system ATP-binding protein
MEEIFEGMDEHIALQATNLKKTFTLSRKQRKAEGNGEKKKVAVNGLSFSVKKGEIYGLLGPNGAGKTTTLRMLATLLKPDEGDVFVGGESVRENPDGVRSKIGFLTSELKPDGFFTPDYMFDFFASLHGVSDKERDERKAKLFEAFGIERFAHTKISELSTGMKQKTSIAISLAHDPEIVVFDEPTNGLDVLTAKAVTDFLIDLKKQGKTVLLSTHIFSLVEKVCDRVGVIIDGKMALEGEVKTLTAQSDLEEVFFELYRARKGEDV